MFNSNLNKIILIFICLFFFESRHIQAQSAAICQGDSAVLRMNCSYSGTIQWQYSSDQATWSTITGATFDTIKVTPSGTTYYRAVILNETCNLVYSDTALITVNAIPSAPFLSVVDTCGNSRLTAGSYTGTLLWSTGQTVNPITVNSAGTYTVSQTVNGCISATGSVTATPLFVPSAPATGTNTPSATQIVWNWNTVVGATGYKYNTVNDYNTATDNLGSISYTQTGLTCNTAYTLYVWAYNSCGNSTVTTLTQTTASCCVANVGAACDKGGWQLQSGCGNPDYGCADFIGIYYNSPNGCDPNTAGSWVEYKFDGTNELGRSSNNPSWQILGDACSAYHCTYVGYASYDPFHYPQPPNGSCFNSSAAGYGGADTYTKVIPGSGCCSNVWVSDMSGVVQCNGACQ